MKSLDSWFEEYSISHQNNKNKVIHAFCVPAIFFSIIGLMWSSSLTLGLTSTSPFNLAFFVPIIIALFYWQLSKPMMLALLALTAFCFAICFVIILFESQLPISLFWLSIFVFIIAWIGQFWGHKIEGTKPSFMRDLQFLLIGPAWVLAPLLNKLRIRY